MAGIAELGTVQVGQKKLRQFKVTVKNGYSQPVVAYAFEQQDLTVGNGTVGGVETNGASVGWALAPNATDETLFTAPAQGEVVISVAAVLLEDGRGDGDTARLARLKEVRAGVKLAYQQIMPLLRRASNSTADQGSEADLLSLENEISDTVDEQTVQPISGVALPTLRILSSQNCGNFKSRLVQAGRFNIPLRSPR